MAVDISHAGFDRRLTRVQQLLQDQGLEVANISPLAYDAKWIDPSSNFLFKVDLAIPALASTFPGTQPGTCKAPPEGVSVLVVKLSNPAVKDVNNANRIENDVAAQHLVRECLNDPDFRIMEQVVPNVYAWAKATTADAADEEGFGWIISEFRDGVELESVFNELEPSHMMRALEEIKNVYVAIRFSDLPEGVTKFGGGLKFDSNGQVVDGEAPIKHLVKPAASYLEWKVGHLRAQLGAAADSPVIQGWERNGVAARIDAFLTGGGPEKVLSDVKIDHKSLIHCDLTAKNILWDPKEMEITAILDFEFAHVNHPYEEFNTESFSHIGVEYAVGAGSLPTAILSGDFTDSPDDLMEEWWILINDWKDVLGHLAPSEMEGIEGIRDLEELQRLLCPRHLSKEDMSEHYNLAAFKDEKKAKLLAEAEAELLKWLEKHGF